MRVRWQGRACPLRRRAAYLWVPVVGGGAAAEGAAYALTMPSLTQTEMQAGSPPLHSSHFAGSTW